MGNPLSTRQWVATGLLFSALFADILFGRKYIWGPKPDNDNKPEIHDQDPEKGEKDVEMQKLNDKKESEKDVEMEKFNGLKETDKGENEKLNGEFKN